MQYDELNEDGTWKSFPQDTALMVIDYNDDRNNRRMEFEYTTEGDYIKSISIHHDWNSVFYLRPLENIPFNLACSVLMAQEGCGFLELKEFQQLYKAHQNDKSATIVYKNIVVRWEIVSKLEMHDGILFANSEDNLSAEMEFTVTIN